MSTLHTLPPAEARLDAFSGVDTLRCFQELNNGAEFLEMLLKGLEEAKVESVLAFLAAPETQALTPHLVKVTAELVAIAERMGKPTVMVGVN